ncbi:MAG: hypothetical protein AMXMBFR84_17590 [Candidatus Hydrogenedentota bacterium]
MTTLVYVFFYGSFACYALSAVAVSAYLADKGEKFLRWSTGSAGAGSVVLLAGIVLKGLVLKRLPFTDVSDAFSMLIVFATLIGLSVAIRGRVPALLCFYVPPVFALFVANLFVGPFGVQMSPEGLNWAMMVVHVAPAFFAYALFVVASLTSMAYIFQVRRLKQMRLTGLFQRLPSLEQLDRMLYSLILAGYIAFTITLVLGMWWAYFQGNLLNATWWQSPKIWRAVLMVVFYAFAFHSRQVGWLRGQKLAYLIFVGFTSLVLLYLGLNVLQLSDYRFWEASA